MLLVLGLSLLLVAVTARAVGTDADRIPVEWTSVGPGGGGGHFYPSFSESDPKLMMFSCDMGGIYVSHDGARSWRVIPGNVARKLSAYPAFHPTDPETIFIICHRGLLVSRDKGITWKRVLGRELGFRGKPYSGWGISIDSGDPDTIIAGFERFERKDGTFVFLSTDGGRRWKRVEGWPGDVSVESVHFDPRPPEQGRVIYAAGRNGVKRSADWGTTWTTLNSGLPRRRITSFAAAWDKEGRSAFYVTVPGQVKDGRYVGGVYKSTDEGRSWHEASSGLYRGTRKGRRGITQYNTLTMGREDLDLVYVVGTGVASEPGLDRTVFRTTDGGRNWTCQLYGPHKWKECNVEHEWMNLYIVGGWGWGGGPWQMTCCSTQPELVFYTNGGNGFMTTDAGENWEPVYTDRVRDNLYRGRGCEVLTCYEVYIDPFEAARRYIAYTDIGLFMSPTNGESWAYAATGSPWANTCYEMAFDPNIPGRIYGAWSNFHDLPHKKMLSRPYLPRSTGGVCITDDFGMNWKPIGGGAGGLPDGRGTCTTVVLDPDSPRERRTLYAGFLSAGVYKSTDGGLNWKEANRGLPAPPRRNVWRLVRRADGTLLCGVTANFPEGENIPGALFLSTDGAEHWREIAVDQPFRWICGVRAHPTDADTFYVSCFEVPPDRERALGTETPWAEGDGTGGVYKTTDGGKTFTKILDRPYCWDVTFHPRNPDIVFACTYVDGVFLSTDAGKTFRALALPPFLCTHRVTVDPEDDSVIWVTTFGGGVWKGRMEDG